MPQIVPVNVVLLHSADLRSIDGSKAIAHSSCFIAMDLHMLLGKHTPRCFARSGPECFLPLLRPGSQILKCLSLKNFKFAFEMLSIVSRNDSPPLFFPMSMYVYLNNLFGLLCHPISVAYMKCHPGLKNFCL